MDSPYGPDDDGELISAYEVAEGTPWDANESGLWCPMCGNHIAPTWFYEMRPKYEPPERCDQCNWDGEGHV